MFKIKFTNNKEFEYLEAFETEEFYNGSNRRTLTVHCTENAVDLSKLNAILSDEENLVNLVLINTDINAENIYSNYVLKLEIGVKNKKTANETPDIPAIYENRLIFKLGQRTYIEQQLKKLGI